MLTGSGQWNLGSLSGGAGWDVLFKNIPCSEIDCLFSIRHIRGKAEGFQQKFSLETPPQDLTDILCNYGTTSVLEITSRGLLVRIHSYQINTSRSINLSAQDAWIHTSFTRFSWSRRDCGSMAAVAPPSGQASHLDLPKEPESGGPDRYVNHLRLPVGPRPSTYL